MNSPYKQQKAVYLLALQKLNQMASKETHDEIIGMCAWLAS